MSDENRAGRGILRSCGCAICPEHAHLDDAAPAKQPAPAQGLIPGRSRVTSAFAMANLIVGSLFAHKLLAADDCGSAVELATGEIRTRLELGDGNGLISDKDAVYAEGAAAMNIASKVMLDSVERLRGAVRLNRLGMLWLAVSGIGWFYIAWRLWPR